MKMYQLAMLACICAWSVGAQAQWQWLDKDGRKVFSDLAPPSDIPQNHILKRPGGQRTKAPDQASAAPVPPALGAGSLPAALPADTAAAARAASQPAPAGIDKELQQRKAQLEAQEAARKKAEDAKNTALRADNCSRAQRAKGTYASGRPLRQTNAQGELVWMDEAARADEMRRIQGIIASDCNPRP